VEITGARSVREIIALGPQPKERRQDTGPSVNFKDGDVHQRSLEKPRPGALSAKPLDRARGLKAISLEQK
jgi:hypothetical protein